MTRVSRTALEQAIDWHLEFSSGELDIAQRSAFEVWRQADPEHEEAWVRLHQIEQDINRDSTPLVRATLLEGHVKAQTKSKTITVSALGLTLAVTLGLSVLNQQRPLTDYMADEITQSGEHRQLQLADQSTLTLNSRTAVDIKFTAKERRLVLLNGEILIETAHGDQRPFIVETAQGRLHALGTRFLVSEHANTTRLTVLKSAVEVTPTAVPDNTIIEEGQQVVINAKGISSSTPAPLAADAWSHGMLLADNLRLSDLLDTLGEYRSGFLSVDPSIANLRISGSFPLFNTDLALAALPPSLPVQIEQHSKWWVKVVPAAPLPATQTRP
ncbi:FecR family protein [Pseudomonas sp. MS19]|uniref:FecR domain-containing protein n=1 Tax=Pseudomonas sp. MS19 TaxID=2579939 RepID=UPI001562D3F8|nr:FecR family protein [Pseudomonas sp. MS19]NRH29947.1 FecR family protein [Pseudomonas sp. MS19]